MLSCHGPSVLSLLVVLTTASGVVACGHKASDSLDAASDAASDAAFDADTTSDASSGATGGGTIASDAGAATVVAPEAAPLIPRPTPFTGTYRCPKGGMQLEQTGNIVMSTTHRDSTVDTLLVCTAVGDTCTGTVRDIHLVKTKSKKVGNVRPVTVLRTGAGDVIVKLGSEPAPAGARTLPSSKAAAGEQTFCRRR
jgi:hypothetical protein